MAVEQEISDEAVKASAFLSNLYRLVEIGQENAAMRAIYSYFYDLRMQEDDGLCGRILEDVEVARLPPSLLVAVLTITAPLKERLLQKRLSFFHSAKKAIAAARGPEAAQRILVGLE